MITLIMAMGLVLVIEGLALALAPTRLEDLLALFSAMSKDQRRMIGLSAVTIGVVVVALARWLGKA